MRPPPGPENWKPANFEVIHPPRPPNLPNPPAPSQRASGKTCASIYAKFGARLAQIELLLDADPKFGAGPPRSFNRPKAARVPAILTMNDAIPRNSICLWYEKDALEAARFYAATFPDSAAAAIDGEVLAFPQGDCLVS